MRILFTFENGLPSNEADAEVFITTAKHIAPLISRSWLHVPLPANADSRGIGEQAGMPLIRAYAPLRPAMLRHLCCGLTMLLRKEFWEADLVYTRNLWIAWIAALFRQQVVFDHYRPWPDQIPPLRYWIFRLMCARKFLVNICHSDYTRTKYLSLGVPPEKLQCVHNGFEPQRLQSLIPREAAKQQIDVPVDRKTIVYIGRLNHKKGLELVIEAARRSPDLLFILVGSYGQGPIETLASAVGNIRIVPWHPPDTLGHYLSAADVLLIPPSWKPLARFGSTVLPLKIFFYMASDRPILAGDTPDVQEILKHRENALLCRPDCVEALVAALHLLTSDTRLAARLAAAALAGSRGFTWDARAHKIIDIIESRLRSGRGKPADWSRAQGRAWICQSWRWLAHLVREGSWVLPPEGR